MTLKILTSAFLFTASTLSATGTNGESTSGIHRRFMTSFKSLPANNPAN